MARVLKIITASGEMALSLAEAKLHLRIENDVTAEDSLITSIIMASIEAVERRTGLQLVTATWELQLDAFELETELPVVPLIAITSVKYIDTDGEEQTVDPSVYGSQSPSFVPGKVYMKTGQLWPTDVSSNPGAVRIRYTAGYGESSAVPASIKAALRLMVGHLYENREGVTIGATPAVLPMAVEALLSGYSLGTVPV